MMSPLSTTSRTPGDGAPAGRIASSHRAAEKKVNCQDSSSMETANFGARRMSTAIC